MAENKKQKAIGGHRQGNEEIVKRGKQVRPKKQDDQHSHQAYPGDEKQNSDQAHPGESDITPIKNSPQHGVPRQRQTGFLAAAYFIETHRSEGTDQGEGGGERISEITEAESGGAKNDDDTARCINPAKNEAIDRCSTEIA